MAKANACGRDDADSTDSASTGVEVNSTPEVNLLLDGPDQFGQALATVHYHFPNTAESSERGLGLSTSYGFTASFAGDKLEDDWFVNLDVSCLPSDTYTVTAKANACHKNETGYVDSDTKPVTVSTKANVSLSYSEQSGVEVHYEFPGSRSSAQRGIALYVDDALLQPTPPFDQNGVWRPLVGSCWKKLRVVATPCGHPNDSE
jgi:hypothetical protein